VEPYYLEIRTLHIAAALTSGALFLARGLALNGFGARWPRTKAVRYLSWAVDSVLLGAAVTLMTLVRQYPGVDAWLTVKVGLVVLYIVLGYYALGRARSRSLSVGLWLAALIVFAGIYSVARAHHPLGALAP
jgi:uncharacterized membrane protein SirB2